MVDVSEAYVQLSVLAVQYQWQISHTCRYFDSPVVNRQNCESFFRNECGKKNAMLIGFKRPRDDDTDLSHEWFGDPKPYVQMPQVEDDERSDVGADFVFFGKTAIVVNAQKLPTATSKAVAAQMLPTATSKGSYVVHAVIPVQSRAESGTFKSVRVEGRVPGLPYTFAFPAIVNAEDQRHPAAEFGFQGYLEVGKGSEIGTFGSLQSPSPAIKMVGKGAYFQRDARALGEITQRSTTPLANIGPEWEDLAFARSALLTNTEAFFRTPAFEAAASAAALDIRFDPGDASCVSLTKTRGAGLQCLKAAQSRRFSPTLSRYVIVTKPPPGSHFGATITAISGGDSNERGAARPYKLTLARAGDPSRVQKVTLWPSDVPIELAGRELKSTLLTANILLLITGTPSEIPGGVEYVVRAMCEAKAAMAAKRAAEAEAVRAAEVAAAEENEFYYEYEQIKRNVDRRVDALARRCWVGMPFTHTPDLIPAYRNARLLRLHGGNQAAVKTWYRFRGVGMYG